MKTVRIWILLISFTALLVGQAGEALAIPKLDIETALLPDNTIEAKIYLDDVQDLHKFSYALVFDPSILEVTDVNMGQFFSRTPTAEQAIAGVDNERGVIGPVTTILISETLVSGSGLASIVKFKAKRPAATVVEFSYRYLEGTNGAEITCSTNQGAPVLIDTEQFHKIEELEGTHNENPDDDISDGIAEDMTKDRADIDHDLSVSFKADKKDKKIILTADVYNDSGTDKRLEFPSSQRYEIEISKQGETIYRWSEGKLFLMGFEDQVFAPGSTRFLEEWEIPQGRETGVYQIMFSITAVEPVIGRMQISI